MYKLKHIPTGLFFKPARGYRWQGRVNLNKTGKLYSKRPTFFNRYSTGVRWRKEDGTLGEAIARPSDWEVVEFIVSEKLNKQNPLTK